MYPLSRRVLRAGPLYLSLIHHKTGIRTRLIAAEHEGHDFFVTFSIGGWFLNIDWLP